MPQQRSKFQYYQESSLSQKLAYKHPEFQDYAGTDPKTSTTIALLNVLDAFEIIDLKDESWKFLKALLNERRKALFATSKQVNEISKMGMQNPKAEHEFFGSGEDE